MARPSKKSAPFTLENFKEQIKGRPPFELAQIERDVVAACDEERARQTTLEAQIRKGQAVVAIGVDDDLDDAEPQSAVQ